VLEQVLDLLQRRERVTYRVLKRQFQLDDDVLEDLKEELIYGQRLAMDEDGRVLVWTGGVRPSESVASAPPHQEAPQAASPAQAASPPAASPVPDAERRQLTVLFCDLVDSTVLASQLDPEELRAVIRAYQDTCAKVIACFEGHIAQYLGDGLLVYFGYSLAHEDDAQRAVRAGLGMVEALGQRNTRLGQERGVHLAVRLGVHTGLVVVGLLLILGGGVTVWQRFFRPPSHSGAGPAKEALTLALPDKPSIAVLPFVNLSGDPAQEYFSDGMTEDLITDLSKLSGLFVIARNSVFTYKGQAVKPQQVSQELGVRYVLEGSVRKAENRVRITAQLVETATGYQRWAERYDRPLQEIFALQDEIRQKIVMALKVQLTQEEQARFRHFPTNNLEAYDALLHGLEYVYLFTQEANVQARQLFESARALDPQYAAAYALLGFTYLRDWIYQWSQDPQTLERAFALAQRAIALDDALPVAHRVLGYVQVRNKQYDQAIAEAERAIALDPNDAKGYLTLAEILEHVGRPQEAFGLVEQAMRLDPQQRADYAWALGHAYYLTGQYEEAIAAFKRTLVRYPNHLAAHAFLAASYSELDREEEARAAMAEVLRLTPRASYEGAKRTNAYKDPAVGERLGAAQTVAVPPPGVVLAKPVGPSKPSQMVGTLVIHAGQVIDGTGRAPLVDAVLVVEGGKITAMGQAGVIAIPSGATRLEVPAKTVIPGLIDMSMESYADWMQPLFLQHGVTTVREVGNDLDVILIYRRRSQKPDAKRPRIFACGPVIDGPNSAWGPWKSRAVTSADEARTVARELLARQVDCLKVAMQLTPPQIQAIVEEAAAHGVPVTAQLGATTAAEAMALGVTGMERTLGIDYRSTTDQELQALARLLAAKGVFVVPTLVNHEQASRLLDPALRQDPLLQYVPLAWFGWWDAPAGARQWTEADSARQRYFLTRKKVLLEAFARANDRVVAGSATPNPYVLPGAGLQRELELLVEAGLTPMQAISAATKVAAECLGQETRLGTLEVDKLADLVILGGNPLEDIHQIRQVETVLRDGQTVWKK
jgi:TolB-like protein/imidazolonepropionase-like amidohydrolase/class 3 adenylate cyclase